MVKYLNLYAGIGGNRKLLNDVEVTAIEIREDIAAVYKSYFPKDKIIIGDAHKYLLNNYYKFDFIWSSVPCQIHSRANFWSSRNVVKRKKAYPDLQLYEEIIFLKNWFNGGWVVESVIPYYEPLIRPSKELCRHMFWSNFRISDLQDPLDEFIKRGSHEVWKKVSGFDLTGHKLQSRKDQIYRNCVHPEMGLHVFNNFKGIPVKSFQASLFE